MMELDKVQRRVLLLAPARADAPALRELLGRAGIATVVCRSVAEICREIPKGLGAAVIAEEAFGCQQDIDDFQNCLVAEPAWSEPPLLIVTGMGGSLARRVGWFPGIANIVFLERPLRGAVLTSALRAALLARDRQLQLAQHLRAREENEQRLLAQEVQLRRLTETLEDRVQERTRELATANARLMEEAKARAKAERALLHAQKLEAIGHLTGGIAHDFNNLLMVILSGLELIKNTGDVAKRERIWVGIEHAANRGKALTKQMLAFSRNIELHAETVDIVGLLDGMNILVTGGLRKDIVVEFYIAQDLWRGLVDPTQLEL
ncbi:MAG TPA: hypothetical protein VN629_09915, partial [Castellaniella sp.]|nr:hypothetical protein [Castellaniella sp.]